MVRYGESCSCDILNMKDLGFISETAATTTASPQNPSCIQDRMRYDRNAEARIQIEEYIQSNSSNCERKCSSISECRYWTYTRYGECEIYKTKTATTVMRDHVSGSRNCPHVSNSVFLEVV